MTSHEILTARLGDEELARVDKLAGERGISREQMLAALVVSGLALGEMEQLLAGRSVPVAVMSSSLAIRAGVTALSWFNRKFRAFPPA